VADFRQNKKLSDEFINKLMNIAAGYLSPESFDKVISLFEYEISRKYFTYTSESNLLRIILGMFDKISFLNECLKYPHYIEILVTVSANSNYLTDILVRDPEYLYIIVNQSRLRSKLNIDNYTETVRQTLNSYKSFHAKLNAIRSLKRKEILRIGVRDILGEINLKEVTEELSILAKVLTSELFSICYNEVLIKNDIKEIKREYCIAALGKLGGNELNYSSDVDLLIFYDEDQQIKKNKEYQDLLIEAIYLFIESAVSITASGYIYRVDFRLRPDGRNSALCRTIMYYLNYYESKGEDWERQMLIKLGYVSGSENLFNRFKNLVTPFIYPSSFSISPTEQIKRLKQSIESRLIDVEGKKNIKLIPGGIRDIEFSVQALQLLNGGMFEYTRTGNTLNAIEQLLKNKFLKQDEAKALTDAYILYRRIEHYLQLMNDAQTHLIPSEGEMLEKMSCYLGFENSFDFNEVVKKQRKEVIKIYNSIMGINKGEEKPRGGLPEIIFENESRALKDLQYLRDGKGLLGQKQFDKESMHTFKKIEPYLIQYLKNSLSPDLVLQNFVRIIKPETFQSIWYKEFTDKKFFKSFLTLCEYSKKAVDIFSEDSSLKEFFLTRKVFEKITINEIIDYSVKRLVFLLSVQHTLNLISSEKVSLFLSSYFKRKIEITASSFLKNESSEYFIASMGSFSSGEMTFASDIDLIFIVKYLDEKPHLQKLFQKLLLEFKSEFKPFDVDCRLRPEGKSSLLVWDLLKYQDYIKNRARTWELQSLLKINFICGNKKLYRPFTKAISERIKNEDKQKIKFDIIQMRQKLFSQGILSASNMVNLKKRRGGLTDIEFIIQYLILGNPVLFTKCRGKGTTKIISVIANYYKSMKDLKDLKDNFSFLKKLELTNQNLFNSSSSIFPSDEKKKKILATRMGFSSAEELNKEVSSIFKTNFVLFEKYISTDKQIYKTK